MVRVYFKGLFPESEIFTSIAQFPALNYAVKIVRRGGKQLSTNKSKYQCTCNTLIFLLGQWCIIESIIIWRNKNGSHIRLHYCKTDQNRINKQQCVGSRQVKRKTLCHLIFYQLAKHREYLSSWVDISNTQAILLKVEEMKNVYFQRLLIIPNPCDFSSLNTYWTQIIVLNVKVKTLFNSSCQSSINLWLTSVK